MTKKINAKRWEASRLSVSAGLLGAPFSWVALMSLSYVISSYTCYPHKQPLNMPLWQSFEIWIMAISGICLVCAIISYVIAYINWHRTKNYGKDQGKDIAETGEGRARFLAMFGVLSSLLFIIAIIFTTSAILLVSQCR